MKKQEIKLAAKNVNGIILDCFVETGPRGGKKMFWRRADRRSSAKVLISLWTETQAEALELPGFAK